MARLLRVDAKGTASMLGPLETQVMEELWRRRGWSSVADIMPVFESKLAYSTIKSILTNLAVKGHLKKRAIGRANEFSPIATRAAFEARVVEDFVRPLLTQYRNPLLAHIVQQLDDDDGIIELERLLAEKRGKRRDG